MVDIAAPLTSDECAGLEYFTFNVTGVAVSIPALHDGSDSCAILDTEMPFVDGTPCAATVGTVAASSIEAQITERACGGIFKVDGCPPSPSPTKSKNAGMRIGKEPATILLAVFVAGFLLCWL